MKKEEALFVAIGGSIGAGARFTLTEFLISLYPLGTFLANTIGCFVIGFIASFMLNHAQKKWVWPLIATGFCGGFTTMSTFSYDFFMIIEENSVLYSIIYVLGTWIMGICSIFAGYYIQKNVKKAFVKDEK
jgi:fluoride exporter